MLIKNVKLQKKDGIYNILIEDGLFKEITTASIPYEGETIDVGGKLALPPYVESHIHLDCVMTAGNPSWNLSGTLFEGIQRWSERKEAISESEEEVKNRIMRGIALLKQHGIQFVRTHVDTTERSLKNLDVLLQIKEDVKSFMEIQIVAFPQEGILTFPEGVDLLETALKKGADVVGGIPHYEFTREDGVASVNKIFELATKYNKLIDIHCDEIDDPNARFVETVAKNAINYNMGHRVSASHTTAMHSYNNAYAYRLMQILQKAEMNFISCPTENIHLQGRFDAFPKIRGITRVKELKEVGINVSLGQDSIFDPWYPLGNGSLLREVDMCLHSCHMMGYEDIVNALDLITTSGAKSLNIEERYGISKGKPANLIVVDAEDAYSVIQNHAQTLLSIYKGKKILKVKPAEITNY